MGALRCLPCFGFQYKMLGEVGIDLIAMLGTECLFRY